MVNRIDVFQTEWVVDKACAVAVEGRVDVECTVNLLVYARCSATRNRSMALIPINGTMMPPTP